MAEASKKDDSARKSVGQVRTPSDTTPHPVEDAQSEQPNPTTRLASRTDAEGKRHRQQIIAGFVAVILSVAASYLVSSTVATRQTAAAGAQYDHEMRIEAYADYLTRADEMNGAINTMLRSTGSMDTATSQEDIDYALARFASAREEALGSFNELTRAALRMTLLWDDEAVDAALDHRVQARTAIDVLTDQRNIFVAGESVDGSAALTTVRDLDDRYVDFASEARSTLKK